MHSSSLAQRLDRLRESAPRDRRALPARSDHAATLAAALGGRATDGIVSLDSSVALPVERDLLAQLPYGVPTKGPLVCLDLETTGLATAAGTVAFLVGLGWWESDRFTVRQLLLPDHAGETSLLDTLEAQLPGDAWLVTYNGRCFDWPLLTARYRLHRRAAPPLAGHTDLLPIARQLWKHRTGSARLAVIENAVCGVSRHDDLPGSEVPERYFAYLRTRRPELLRAAADHNRQDIVSLGLLVARLARMAARETWPDTQPGDLYGMARTMARRGLTQPAVDCLDAALAPARWEVRGPAGVLLHRAMSGERARLLARLGRRSEAHAAWLDIARRGGPGAAAAWLHVARHREHVERDPAGALAACHQAAAICGRARAWGRPLYPVERDLARRLPRLARKAFSEGTTRISAAA